MCEELLIKYYTDRLTPHEDGDLISAESQTVSDLTDEGGVDGVVHFLHSKPGFLHLHCFRHQSRQTEGHNSDNISTAFLIETKLKRPIDY